MVGNLVSADFTSSFSFWNYINEIFPFRVTQEMLQIASQPKLNSAIGLLSEGFEVAGKGMDEVRFHLEEIFAIHLSKYEHLCKNSVHMSKFSSITVKMSYFCILKLNTAN